MKWLCCFSRATESQSAIFPLTYKHGKRQAIPTLIVFCYFYAHKQQNEVDDAGRI